ncbi:MAG: EAL domain-containing protein [Burkholderiales bacterium]
MKPDFFENAPPLLELIDAIPVAVFVKSAAGEFLLTNRACEDQWGVPFDVLRGTTGRGHFPADRLQRDQDKDREVFAGGKPVDFLETYWNARHRSERIGHTFKKPVFDADGAPLFIIGATIDVTERAEADSVLRANEEKLRKLFELSSIGIARNAMDGTFIEANAAFLKIVGYGIEELNCLTYWDLTPREYEPLEQQQLEQLRTLGRYGPYEKEYLSHAGERVAVRLSGELITDSRGDQYIWSIVEDISERRHVETELRLAGLVYQTSSEGMLITDADNRIIGANPAFLRMSGYGLDEILGQNPRLFQSGHHERAFYEEMWRALGTRGVWRGELWDRHKNGEVKASRLTINAVRDEHGAVQRYVALFSDITEKKRTDETIWRQANFDGLTDLPNRRMFRDRLEQELLKSARGHHRFALFLVDLDHFKEVNDTLGHPLGDLLLVQAARRLADCVRQSDTVARLGGDEFGVLVGNVGDHLRVEAVARKIIDVFAEPFRLEQEAAYVSTSVGVTIYPDDAETADALMKNADQAMYEAKNRGRNRFAYFTPSMQEGALQRLRLINDLRQALGARQFEVHFQPIVELATGRVNKVEALLRWNHPGRGSVSPSEFIPLAEDAGLIVQIGDWVFVESVRWARRWQQLGPQGIQVSVNKSPAQFRADSTGLRNAWKTHLATHGVAGRSIVVEITEGLLLNAEADVQDKLLEFRDAGVHVAIDDFGTGYSALAYLKKFDIDYLKLDRSFVQDIDTDADDLALSEAIVAMAHKLGLKVVAEGVETTAQRERLMAIGCDYAQGYLFARPMPPEQFEETLKRCEGRLA